MKRLVVSIAAVCLVAGACSAQTPAQTSPGAPSGPSPTAVSVKTTPPTAATVASPTVPAATPMATWAATFAPAASGPPESIAVELGTCCALTFVPYALTAKAGTLALFLINPVNKEHPFSHDMQIGTVQGQPLASSPVLRNGETGVFTIDALPAGDYVFWCSVNRHAQEGMIGTLTVTP